MGPVFLFDFDSKKIDSVPFRKKLGSPFRIKIGVSVLFRFSFETFSGSPFRLEKFSTFRKKLEPVFRFDKKLESPFRFISVSENLQGRSSTSK